MRPLLVFGLVVASWLSLIGFAGIGILDSVQFVAKVALRKELLVVFVLEA